MGIKNTENLFFFNYNKFTGKKMMNLIFFPFFSFFNIIAMHILYTSVQSKIKLVEGQSYSKFRNVLIYVRDIIKIVCFYSE